MRNLSTKGLSMSQAQSISNLCNQRTQNIDAEISIINNASKTITINGETYEQEEAHPMPMNITELIMENYHYSLCGWFKILWNSKIL